VAEQTRVALDKIRVALEEAGSSLDHIVKMTIYLREMSEYQAMRDAEFRYYQNYCPSLVEDPPASTVVQVVSLSKPNMLVEFDVIALVPDS
jgi:2-iminobutanoate/2-iminopropanoate deaminase